MKTLSLLFCTAVACIMMPGSDSNAQTYSLGTPVSSGCGVDGGYIGSGCGVDGGYADTGCGINGGGNVGSGCGVNGGCGCNAGGCGTNTGGCGTNGGCGIGGRCGIGRGLRQRRLGCGPGLWPNGRLRGLLSGGNHVHYLSADFGWAVMDSMAEIVAPNGVAFSLPRFELEDNVVGRIGIGKYIGPWRVESEVGYREFHINDTVRNSNFRFWDGSGRRETTTMMLNIFRDFNCGGRLRPYAKGGVGASYNKSSGSFRDNGLSFPTPVTNVVTFPEDESYELAWSVGGGLGICLTERLIMDLEYQFVDLGATKTGNNQTGSALGMGDGVGHEFTLGFRVNY